MNIDNLVKILPPPEIPREVPSLRDIVSFESKIAKLPSDYISYLKHYGTGSADNFICIYNPVSKNIYLNLFERIQVQLEALREIREFEGDKFPYAIFPEKDGLLPFGATDNGDFLCWKTNADQAHWKVVVAEARAQNYEEYDMGIAEFLHKILKKEIRVNIFPEDFPSEQPRFFPLP